MMTLASLSFTNVGPFAQEDKITFEDDVTAIVGQNDVGKSLLLGLIEQLMLRDERSAIKREQVAIPHMSPPTAPWETDESISALMTFVTGETQGASLVECSIRMAPKCFKANWYGKFLVDGRTRDAQTHHGSLRGLPRVVYIHADAADVIRSEVPLGSMNELERALLRVAFQNDIHAGEYQKLTRIERRAFLAEAERRLNERLSQFLPKTIRYEFILEPPSESTPVVEIGLIDGHGGYTQFGQRGAGLQKMINLLGRLAVENIGLKPTILLIDEPENSLHADAQHALRYALEQLGALDNVQVIYSTHSPAMINTMRPESLRLLVRQRRKNRAETAFLNAPVGDNYELVRSTLGTSPSDSLMYAPVCILVEGATEARSIPILMKRLQEANVEGFSDAVQIMSNCAFITVDGDKFSSQCSVTKAFGVTPIVFTDGDIEKRVREQLKKAHRDVTVISLSQGEEIEDMVARNVYFESLAMHIGRSTDDVSQAGFNEWDEQAELPERMMFSKRVCRWVQEKFTPNFSGKPAIMVEACLKTALSDLKTDKLAGLLAAVRVAIHKSVAPFAVPED